MANECSSEEWLQGKSLKESDSIFKKSPNWMMNSCLNFAPDMTGAYTRGFKAMAQVGIEAIRDNRSQQDILVYPIVFNFRHHIELQLKEAIGYGFEFLDRSQSVPNIHSIDKLWSELKSVLAEVKKVTGQCPDASEIKNAERVIMELVCLDPEGINFRYAKNKKGEGSIDQELRILNLESFSGAIDKLSFFLDCVVSHLHFLFEYKNEAEAEMRRMS
ncbi:hypothetical protein EZJ49_06655 [Bdellovibrio bacteriovorus]|uniref:hypothetical protein n=1 Tax=Bdellovibrio bacteriovorus TaxID=959 RepID=UPI0021CEA801|nr:hypothetical protein [Bdellovibrio bacteriovorus]UXR65925.1 hypothetical protein EZJ49_06655 [Bdellovibrio bacteriovorus]